MELPGLTVNRFSGPVSMYYLRPTIHKQSFPLLVLFGDIHEFDTGMCNDCECDQDAKTCCMSIADPTWLKALDQIAKDYPVDFYTESYKNTFGKDSDILFRKFLSDMTLACHRVQNRTRKDYNEVCPTENVRWHHIDVRFMRDTVEGNLLMPYRGAISNIYFLLKNLKKGKQIDLNKFCLEFFRRIGVDLEGDYEDNEDEAKNFTERALVGLDWMRLIVSVVLREGDISSKIAEMNAIWWQALREMSGTWKSGIMKQLKKITLDPYRSVAFWEQVTLQNLLTDRVLSHYFEQFEEEWKSFPERELFEEMTVKKLDENIPDLAPLISSDTLRLLESFEKLLTMFGMKAMDVYYVTRMLKNPSENAQPVLALGFFGDFHTRTIVEMLTQSAFGYEVEVIQAADPVWIDYDDPRILRCVNVSPHTIPLESDVLVHGASRDVSPYKAVLRREREAREFHSSFPFMLHDLQFDRLTKPRSSRSQSVTDFLKMFPSFGRKVSGKVRKTRVTRVVKSRAGNTKSRTGKTKVTKSRTKSRTGKK